MQKKKKKINNTYFVQVLSHVQLHAARYYSVHNPQTFLVPRCSPGEKPGETLPTHDEQGAEGARRVPTGTASQPQGWPAPVGAAGQTYQSRDSSRFALFFFKVRSRTAICWVI